MEDPANKLNIDRELRIKGDNKEQIYKIKDDICRALIAEDKVIIKEIRQLEDNKVNMDEIESEEIELDGISFTSILVYLNEIQKANANPDEMSHKHKPGNAIVQFIDENMGNIGSESGNWREFPRIIMKAITANTFFFTRMMEMCQQKIKASIKNPKITQTIMQ